MDNPNKPPENGECPDRPEVSAPANQREAFSLKCLILMYVGIGLILINILLERLGINVLADFAPVLFLVAQLWWTFEY